MSPFAEPTIVMTGSGFIGGRLVRRFRSEGRDVRSYSSRECDLLNLEKTRAALRDIEDGYSVVFCSAISRVVDDSWQALQKNLGMLRNLLAALESRPPQSFVFLSSVDVYGLPPLESPINELTPTRPTTYYGLAKLASESLLHIGQPAVWRDAQTAVTCLRLPGVYGPGDRAASVVGRFHQQLSAGQPITLSGSGETIRDFVHVDDVCAAIEHFLQAESSTVVNVASGHAVSPLEAMRLIASRLDGEPQISWRPANPDRDHDLVFDITRLKQLAPQLSPRSLTEGIRDYELDAGSEPS